jgi:polyphosphate kinase 2 (PPK2 family)
MKNKINSDHFLVKSGVRTKLEEWPTRVKPVCKSEKKYKKLLEAHVTELSSLQNLHYASNRHALLLIFQGMDASGKDGANWLWISAGRKAVAPMNYAVSLIQRFGNLRKISGWFCKRSRRTNCISLASHKSHQLG